MVRTILNLSVILVSLGLSACGEDSAPSAPTPTTPTVTGLTIAGNDAVLTGLTADYTATATLSNGTTQTATATWTSSNTAVGTVDGNGRVSGQSHGSTTLTATYQGRTASKTVHVVNNYAGTWEGSYVIRACTDSGDLTNRDGGWCRGGPGRVGSVHPIVLTLSHSATNPTEVTRTFPGTDDKLTGSVTDDGRLNIGGTLPNRDFDYPDMILATTQFTAWDTNLKGSSEMTGRWSERYVSLVFRIGSAVMENELVTMTRTTTSAVSAQSSQ